MILIKLLKILATAQGNNNMKVSGVYKIVNTITGDFYIGSSKDVKQRWAVHKCQSVWKQCPNKQLYKDMLKYGVDKFEFEILEEVEAEKLKETEQKFIETLKPTYNSNNANGLNIERYKEYNKKYQKKYYKSDKCKKYRKSAEYKESNKKARNKYNNQPCCYNGEKLTLAALSLRFKKAGVEHCVLEAKKYLVNNNAIEFYDVYP